MPYLRWTPPPPLDRVVDHYWVFEDHEVPADRGVLFADGCTDLMFHLTGAILLHAGRTVSRWSGSWVSGQRTQPIRIELLSRRFTMVGARLRPTGLAALLRAPACESRDLVLELRHFWGSLAAETAELLAAAAGPHRRLACLHEVLRRHLRQDDLTDARLAAVVEDLRTRPIDRRIVAVRSLLGVSHRHLTRLFHAHVGLTPKTFQRIARFRGLLHEVDRKRAAIDWAALALRHGYSDQAHLIREFRGFTGLPPGRYRPPPMQAPDYMPWAEP